MMNNIVAGIAIILYALGLLPCLLMSRVFGDFVAAIIWPLFAILDMWAEWRQSHRDHRPR